MRELKLVASVQDKGVLHFMDALEAHGKAAESAFRKFTSSMQEVQRKSSAVTSKVEVSAADLMAATSARQKATEDYLEGYRKVGEAAESVADKEEGAAKRRKTAAESVSSTTVRATNQLLAAQRDAALAEAKLITDKWERAKAIETAGHNYRRQKLAGNNAAIAAEEQRHVAEMAAIQLRQEEAAKKAAGVVASASTVGVRAAQEEEAATEARTRAYEEWLQKVNSTPVFIANREKLANYGPIQGPPTAAAAAAQAEAAEKYRLAQEARQQSERQTTQIVERQVKRRVEAKAEEYYEFTAYDKELLKITRDTGMAKAHAENNQFDRDIERLRAQANYKLTLAKGDAEKTLRIQEWATERYLAIEKRREQFSNTPFQKHLGVMTQMMMKMGMSAGQAGQAFQQAGFQVGDFATQVASGQGFLRPFIQQGTQLVSMFGPWGAAIGAAGAIVGAFAVYMLKAKEGIDGLTKAIKAADFISYGQQLEQYAEVVRVTNAVTSQAVKQYDFYGVAALSVAGSHQKATAEINEARKALEYIYGSVEKASEAYERLQSRTRKGLEVEARISGLELGGESVENAVKIQQERNKAALEELERGFDAERAAVQRWERKKDADGKKYVETEEQFLKRRDDEIARINSDSARSRELQEKINNDKIAKIRDDAAKETQNKIKEAAEALRTAEAQTQRMRIEAQMVGSARSIALLNAEYDERVRAAKENAKVVAQIEQQRALAIEAIRVGASRREVEEHRKIIEGQQAMEQRRLEVLYAGNEKELLAIRQQAESRRLAEEYNAQLIRDVQEGNYDLMEARYAAYQDALTATAFIHEQERQQLAVKTAEENAKKIVAANEQIAASAFTIAGNFADAFGFERANKFLGVLQKIKTTMEAMAAIQEALGVLRTLGQSFNPLSFIGLGGLMPVNERNFYADGGRPPVGKVSVVGERGPELFIPDTAGTVYSNEDSRRMLARAAAPVIPASIYQQAPAAKPQASAPSVTVQGMSVVVNVPEGATPKQAEELGAAAARGAASGIGYLAAQRSFLDTQRTAAYDRVFG